MRCPICYKNFEGYECPVCSFPVIDIPVETSDNYEESIKELKPTIISYKNEFTDRVNVGIVLNHYSFDGVELSLEKEESIAFGRLSSLVGQTKWLECSFDNMSEREFVDTCVYADVSDRSGRTVRTELTVLTPNVNDGESQRLGITVDESFKLQLNVRSDKGTERASENVYLFN